MQKKFHQIPTSHPTPSIAKPFSVENICSTFYLKKTLVCPRIHKNSEKTAQFFTQPEMKRERYRKNQSCIPEQKSQ
jgi:hypothetical protein